MNKILFFVICAVYCLLTGCADENLYINNRLMMGTMVEVISPEPKASEIVFQEIKRVEGLFSKYDSQSQIFRLNKYGESKVSAEVLYLLNEAGRFYKLSAGAFDITVGPLLKVWGFTDKKYRIPDSAQIKEALALVGYEKIILDEDNFVVKFEVPGMTLDLGGLAKGYAVDSAVRELKEAGVKSCLINAGGDIYCLGNKSGKPWRVGVRQPGSNRIREYVRLRDKAIATSGNYEQYFLNKNRRFSHIFDPRSGSPVNNGISSVTVIADDCVSADALATSVFIMGDKAGCQLVSNFKGAQAKIIMGNLHIKCGNDAKRKR